MSKAHWLHQLTSATWPVVGVIHLAALPGSPRDPGDLESTLATACEDAVRLVEGGVDALIVENFGDAPFLPARVAPVTVAAMTRAVSAIRSVTDRPLGVNVLRNDADAALAVAHVSGAQFVRVNVLAGAMWTDQGLVEGQAHRLLRERRALGAHVRILADVLVKHAAPPAPVSIAQAARDTVLRAGADGILISGAGTGEAPSPEELTAARDALGGAVPVLIGSGLQPDNVAALAPLADGAIVSSCLRRDGRAGAPVEPERVGRLVTAVRTWEAARREST